MISIPDDMASWQLHDHPDQVIAFIRNIHNLMLIDGDASRLVKGGTGAYAIRRTSEPVPGQGENLAIWFDLSNRVAGRLRHI